MTPTILHVLAPARFGGLETVVHALAQGLHERGVPVAVAPVVGPGEADTHPFCRDLREAGIPMHPIEVSGRDYVGERRAVADLLRTMDASVLHTHGYRPDVMDSGLAPRLGIARVTTVHGFTGGGWKNRLYELLQVRTFRDFDAVIAVSAKLAHDLKSRGVPDRRLHVLRNAFPADLPGASREEARATLGLPAHGRVVGWVGRMSPEKAPEIFVQAAPSVRAPDVTFSMVGAGPSEDECRALAATQGMSNNFHFHGSVEGAGTLLRAFDVLAMTSWTEGTPMVLLEAMARQVPVVATCVGGIPDVVSTDEAELCRAGDVAGIARAMDRMLVEPSLAEEKAAAAHRRLRMDLDVDAWIDRHLDIYSTVAGT